MRISMAGFIAGLAAIFGVICPDAGASEGEARFSFTPGSFRAAFDRQAARDGTDPISQCVEVHWVSDCRFRTKESKREAVGAEVPDELFEFVRFDDWRIGGIGFEGSGATPARRAHYVRQFSTLMRVLDPKIRTGDIVAIVDGLGLGAGPKPVGQARSVERPFAVMTCREGGAGVSSIRCSIEPRGE